MKKEPTLRVSGSASSITMPLVRRMASTAARDVGHRRRGVPVLLEPAAHVRIADRRRVAAQPEPDAADHEAAGVEAFEAALPVAEPALVSGQRRRHAGLAVEDVHGVDDVGGLLTVRPTF
jgi:hypothetical protein